jgi:two-component system invasion response regulator UvrY
MPPRIILLDTDAMTLNLLRHYFESKQYEIVAKCATTTELLSKLEQLQQLPDLLIMEIDTAPLNGYELTKLFHIEWPAMKIMVLSKFCTPYSVANLIVNGISGYITKKDSLDEVDKCIGQLMNGKEYFSEIVLNNILAATVVVPYRKGGMLKDKELQFLKYCCSEMPYKEIASVMKTTQRILELYRLKIFNTFDIKSREGMILFALRNAIVPI